jgi:hypothetical protein
LTCSTVRQFDKLTAGKLTAGKLTAGKLTTSKLTTGRLTVSAQHRWKWGSGKRKTGFTCELRMAQAPRMGVVKTEIILFAK